MVERMRRMFLLAVCAAALFPGVCAAEETVDILAWFAQAAAHGAGTARKTKPVDARPAKPGEVVVTEIKGEGKETQSPPAQAGEKVVRNRCAETGNEQILVSQAKFAERYEGPVGRRSKGGWRTFRPRGAEMRFVLVPEAAQPFFFTAPWGEKMVAKPGDAIVQNPGDPKDTYRVAKAAFACTYEVTKAPEK